MADDHPSTPRLPSSPSLDLLDRLAVLYLILPLAIFLLGWFELWAGFPLVLCLAYSLKPLAARVPLASVPGTATRLQLMLALLVASAWTVCGGTGHLFFANADWHLRDAVLHDLVTGQWPVGYGGLGGEDSLLRAPIGYYLPAALIGKAAGLLAAHAGMALWTAMGAALFLLQVLSLTPSRLGTALTVAAIIVLFSGLDLVGTLLHAPGPIAHWDVTRHLEWWARNYQYSSMTTQLFWVPNHALCGWVGMGLLVRSPRGGALEPMLPIVVVAVALWSPLTALGLVPFVLCRAWGVMVRERSLRLLDPRVWAPALAVGIAVAAYLTLDSSRIPRGWTVGRSGPGLAGAALDLARQAEFFMLEAGFIGIAILAIRRSSQVVLALAILALLPLVSFGAANDFVMRVSIPSLTALAIGAGLALTKARADPDARINAALRIKMGILVCLLAVGAVTPFQEFARAAVLKPWPINVEATLVGAACGRYPPHYVARLKGQPIVHLLRAPHPLPLGPLGARTCDNPAFELERERGAR
jgi:hypothetical protein